MSNGVTLSKSAIADMDAYSLVEFQRLKSEDMAIRKDSKRFAAAVKVIEKENKNRKEAAKKEQTARSKAVKQ